MSDFSGKLLDGYALSNSDGYTFVTPWLDLHGAERFSLTAVITGGTVNGDMTLQQSNAAESGNSNGNYPKTALSVTGTPTDAVNTPYEIDDGYVQMALTSSGEIGVINQRHVGYHWARLVWVGTVRNTTGTCDVWFTWKK
jgi:hypothetical protein